MLDAVFFRETLGTLVRQECNQRPGQIPVVHLHLNDGTLLDVCHILQLAPAWMGIVVFRDADKCDDMDYVFLPFGLIGRVTLSLHPAQTRRLGFRVEGLPPGVPSMQPSPAGPE